MRLLALLAALLLAAPALAADQPLTKDEKKALRDAKKAARKAKQESPDRIDPAIFPGVSYDSNRGIGFGVIGNIARFKPDFDPWKWRLAFNVWFYVDRGPDGLPELTYNDDYVDFDQPGLAGGRLRLTSRIWFRRQSDLGWYGLGNASEAQNPWEAIDEDESPEAWAHARRFHEYAHSYPGARVVARVLTGGNLELFGGLSLVWNWIDLYPGSLLTLESGGASGLRVQKALVGVKRHGVLEFLGGAVLDERDEELDPKRGFMIEGSVRGGPVIEEWAGYGGLNAHVRAYLPIHPTRVTLATRVMADVLFGDPPFYELGRFGGLKVEDGPAGAWSLRGPPARRWHGKVKVFGTIELRTRLVTLQVLGNATTLGLNVFVDVGRSWAELTPRPELDGRGMGLKTALGLGGRLRFGAATLVRADVGWSPDGTAVYVDVEHTF